MSNTNTVFNLDLSYTYEWISSQSSGFDLRQALVQASPGVECSLQPEKTERRVDLLVALLHGVGSATVNLVKGGKIQQPLGLTLIQ